MRKSKVFSIVWLSSEVWIKPDNWIMGFFFGSNPAVSVSRNRSLIFSPFFVVVLYAFYQLKNCVSTHFF